MAGVSLFRAFGARRANGVAERFDEHFAVAPLA
jgi:hypothetical protein